jgi:hypothetical protein
MTAYALSAMKCNRTVPVSSRQVLWMVPMMLILLWSKSFVIFNVQAMPSEERIGNVGPTWMIVIVSVDIKGMATAAYKPMWMKLPSDARTRVPQIPPTGQTATALNHLMIACVIRGPFQSRLDAFSREVEKWAASVTVTSGVPNDSIFQPSQTAHKSPSSSSSQQ